MNNTPIWYAPLSSDYSADTVHQTLAFGSLEHILRLKKQLGQKKLAEIFLSTPKKVYTKKSFHFVKDFILHISQPIKDDQYLTFTSRHTG